MTAHRRTVILIATLVALAAACAPAPPPAPVIPLGPDGLYDVPRARTTADVDACTLLTAEELDELFGQYAEALPQRNDPPVCSFVGLGATGPVNLFLDGAMADLLQPGGGSPPPSADTPPACCRPTTPRAATSTSSSPRNPSNPDSASSTSATPHATCPAASPNWSSLGSRCATRPRHDHELARDGDGHNTVRRRRGHRRRARPRTACPRSPGAAPHREPRAVQPARQVGGRRAPRATTCHRHPPGVRPPPLLHRGDPGGMVVHAGDPADEFDRAEDPASRMDDHPALVQLPPHQATCRVAMIVGATLGRPGPMIEGTTHDDCATQVGLAEPAVPRLPPVA